MSDISVTRHLQTNVLFVEMSGHLQYASEGWTGGFVHSTSCDV